MEKTPGQLQEPLTYAYHDPEAAGQDKELLQGDLPKPFTDQQPQNGYEFIPPIGTVPQPLMMQAMTRAILKMVNDKSSSYDGATNEKGLKHGKGHQRYLDGSSYNGEFFEDKRQGFGEYRARDGTVYKGQWVNDMREGQGVLHLPNGETITTAFKHDRKHGRGIISTADGKKRDVIFYNDTQIVIADQNPDCYHLMPINFILSNLVLLFLFLEQYTNQEGYYVGAGIFYIFLLYDICCNRTNNYLSNIISADKVSTHINDLRQKAPSISFVIQNYHYEWETYIRKGSIERRRRRVNTHYAKEPFRYYEYIDTSPDSSAIEYIKATRLARLNFGKIFNYTAQAGQSFQCQEYEFKKHNIRDSHYDYSVANDIDGYEEYVTMFNPEKGGIPWYASKTIYWISSLLLLGWLFKVFFVLNSQRVTYDFIKLIVK